MSTIFYMPYQQEPDAWLLAEGVAAVFMRQKMSPKDWSDMQQWLDEHPDWRFGWVGYNAAHAVEPAKVEADQRSPFPEVFFFVPENVAVVRKQGVELIKGKWKEEFNKFTRTYPSSPDDIVLKPETSREQYLQAVINILEHIHLGDVYEMNYCQVFSAQAIIADPVATWHKLYAFTEAPHAAFAQHEQWHVLSASPERYISRVGSRVFSQPIKGTIRRGKDAEEDADLSQQLLQSKKERAENVMIVDLVRNDLSRFAKSGSVKVDELFGIYSFKTVHHMISTVSCEAGMNVSFTDILRHTFPMGSMTGAPKISAIQLARRYELSSRGVYSGSIGYLTPDGDFDFNVVIRSILYDSKLQLVNVGVGSAITAMCDPVQEYEECLLKAEAVLKALA